MKNVQVIDGAMNCTYDVFALSDANFRLMFPNNTDIEFIKDFVKRVGMAGADKILKPMWNRRLDKKHVKGIHGTLFYELDFKKKYYPTRREDEMILHRLAP